MKGITLPIFHHTDQSATLKDCGEYISSLNIKEVEKIIQQF